MNLRLALPDSVDSALSPPEAMGVPLETRGLDCSFARDLHNTLEVFDLALPSLAE